MGINLKTVDTISRYAESFGVKSALQTKPVNFVKSDFKDLNFTKNIFSKTESKSGEEVLLLKDRLISKDPQSGMNVTKSLTGKLKDLLTRIFKKDVVKQELFDCLVPWHKGFDIEKAKTLFKDRVGLNLHVACPDGLRSFADTPSKVIKYVENGRFPKEEIKHVVLGHGTGTTINDTWVINGTKEKVFDYINKNIPAGEKALVCCCEETPKNLLKFLPKDKPGIGNVVHTELSTKSRPAKIVESGKNEIIGEFAKGNVKYYG